eukprot:2711030-Pyramimonas_sp.AAC.1
MGPDLVGSRNDRGQSLLNWCVLQGLILASAFAGVLQDDLWAFSHAKRQLDYILLRRKWNTHIVECSVEEEIDTGSDHRAVALQMRFGGGRPCQSKKTA